MGPNEENHYFAELRQKVCLYIHKVVLLRCLPSLDGRLERFVTKNGNWSQTDFSTHSLTILMNFSGRRKDGKIIVGEMYSENNKHLSFKYCVKSFLIPKLLTKVS